MGAEPVTKYTVYACVCAAPLTWQPAIQKEKKSVKIVSLAWYVLLGANRRQLPATLGKATNVLSSKRQAWLHPGLRAQGA